MFDFFCSFDGCSMSMSYRVWPSTIATRSSSACVALISIRFIVSSSRALPRGTPGVRARFHDPVRRRTRAFGSELPALLGTGAIPLAGALVLFVSLRGPDDAGRLPDWSRANSTRVETPRDLPDRLTWSPPRGVAAAFPDHKFVGF